METKYYHTRTQEEWDWLFKHFNLVNELPEIYKWSTYGGYTVIVAPADLNNWGSGSKEYYSLCIGVTHFIEVSDLMKEEEMTQKIVFTEEEKEEFDNLKKDWRFISGSLDDIYHGHDFDNLYHRIYSKQNSTKSINLAETEFARAWANPDLIEVKEEPRFAYKLKQKFIDLLANDTYDNWYLSIGGYLYLGSPVYHTAEDWKQVDDDLKVIFDRVEEK